MIPFDFISPLVNKILDFIPDPKAKLAAAQAVQEHETEILKLFSAADVAQAETNKVEAANSNIFISGWRPFVGWVAGIGFAWAVVIQPVILFICSIFHYNVQVPQLPMEILMQALFGLLGLGAMRTYEKKLGVHDKH